MSAGRLGDTSLARLGDLLSRQRAIARPEPQGEGEGPMALGHLRAGVHIEEAHVLAQLPRTHPHGVSDVGGGHRVSDDEGDVLLGYRLGPDIRRGSHIVSHRHQRVEIELEGTGACGE